ncbi:MAG: ATP-binding protein [Gemmatimonadales bacterium]
MTDHWSRERFARGQSLILPCVAEGAPLSGVLDSLLRLIESLVPGMQCSVLLVTDDSRHLVTLSAPSLPPEYSRAVDGIPIGPLAGSCGTAAFLRQPVIAYDIAIDPRWEVSRDVALTHGLRACWSTPIFGQTGDVLGTFAVYHREPHAPTESEIALVSEATGLAQIALEKWKSEQTLAQSEERYRTLVSATAQVVWVWTGAADGRVVAPLSTWQAFTGATDEELIVGGWLRAVHPDDRVATQTAWVRALATHTAYEIEHRIRRADGEWRTMTGHAVPIFAADGSVKEWVGAHTDVTRQRLLESKVAQAQKLESLSVLAGGIAHDFNNLLVGILANAGLALMEVAPDSPARESLAAIESAAGRAADLVRQLLAYSGRGTLDVQTVDLCALVREMANLLASAITRSASVTIDCAEDVPPIRADETQMRQVVMNLITNAAESLDAAGGLIRVSVGTATADGEMSPGRCVFLEVADSGSGMDSATQARIFEPFFTTKFTGRGLGLAAVQGIIRAHAGAIRIRSAPGEGTVFRIVLPMDPTPDTSPRKSKRSPPARADFRGKGTVLVADDEDLVRSTAKRLIERAGFTVLLARNGREAIDLYDAHADEIAVVLLDLTMPVLGGDAAVGELFLRTPRPRVILTSGFTEDEALPRVIGKDVAGFLQKPYHAGELLAAISRCVESR